MVRKEGQAWCVRSITKLIEFFGQQDLIGSIVIQVEIAGPPRESEGVEIPEGAYLSPPPRMEKEANGRTRS